MLKINIKSGINKITCDYNHSTVVNAPVAIVIGSDVLDIETKEPFYEEAINSICDVFIENGFSVVKFNIKDEKPNKKDNDDEALNLSNLTSIIDWLHTKNIDSKNFWVCGIDHSVVPALELVMRRPEIENYILFSPNIRRNDLSFVVPCAASGMLVRASEDLRFSEEDCVNLQEKLTTKTESKIKYMTIYNTERNFVNEIKQLKEEIDSYIKSKSLEDYQTLKTINVNKRRRRKKRLNDGEEEKIIYVNPIKPVDLDSI